MKLQNDTLAIVIKNIKYYVSKLKLSKHFIHETCKDLEQELFCEIWPYLDRYDETKSSFNTFVARLVENKVNNLLHKHSCIKRDISNYVTAEVFEFFYDEIAVHTDVNYMISTLPKEWQNICEHLKYFNLYEVAEMNNVSRTTLNKIIRQIRTKLSPIYYKGKKKN